MGAKQNGTVASFDDMIQADRKKRKNEELANKMLGSKRRKSAPGVASIHKGGAGASLASRVGINKRSASSTPKPNIDGQWTHDLHRERHSRPQKSRLANAVDRDSNVASSIQRGLDMNGSTSQLNIRSQPGGQMSIKGKASKGPSVVIATNFAPGTSAEDIEAAVAPIAGEILSCKLVSSSPNVMVEILIPDVVGAENVIATFNNQRADGRMLYVYMKQGPPSQVHNVRAAAPPVSQAALAVPSPAPLSETGQILGESPPHKSSSYDERERERDHDRDHEREREHDHDRDRERDRDVMEVDDNPRLHRDDGRLNYSSQQAHPSSNRYGQDTRYQDGRYGYGNSYRQQTQGGYRQDYGAGRGYNDGGYGRGRRW